MESYLPEHKYVTYIRRSKKDHDSTLGLTAQNDTVTRYINQKQGKLINEFIEIESGTHRNTEKRVKIHEAIAFCKEHDAVLVIAKLDRLARSVEFISNLLNSKVKFVACDIPEANDLTIHIMAAVAQQEAKRISENTKRGLAVKKKELALKGEKLGWHQWKSRTPENPFGPKAWAKSVAVKKANALKNPHTMKGMDYAVMMLRNGVRWEHIIDKMNRAGFLSPRGKKISTITLFNWFTLYERLHPEEEKLMYSSKSKSLEQKVA